MIVQAVIFYEIERNYKSERAMKNLILLRHAKSSWKDPYLNDHDRPLNKRGKRDAPVMAGILKKYFPRPDMIVASPSKRTRATAEVMATGLGMNKHDIVYDKNIYHADAFTLMHIVGDMENSVNTVLLVGHNPGLTVLANMYAPGITENIPTCGIVGFRTSQDSWGAFITKEDIICNGKFYPKSLPSG